MGVCRGCLCSLNKSTDAVNIFDHLYKNINLSILIIELFNIKVSCRQCLSRKHPTDLYTIHTSKILILLYTIDRCQR